MLQAMNTGHDGSLTTIHANSGRDALTRLETLVAMAGLNLSNKALRHYISSALNVIIQLARLSDGSRKIIGIQEVTGMEGEIVTTQDIFSFQQTGMDQNGRIKGRFKTTGVRPKFIERFQAYGISVSSNIFDAGKVYEC
jgi:pilus assembly protein CpaF